MNGLSVPRLLACALFATSLALLLSPSAVQAGNEFQRGDFTVDGDVNIGDPIGILNYLTGGPPALCLDATDANDDGEVNVVDPIYLLYFLFGLTAPPPPPFMFCGSDPTADSIDCDSYPLCP